MMTIVYRFECGKCEKGPYRCVCDESDRLRELLNDHCGCPDHPVPCAHVRDYLWRGYTSGMEDLDSLLLWFDDLLPELHAAGMVLAWYEIDDANVIPICRCKRAAQHVLMEPNCAQSRSTMTIEG